MVITIGAKWWGAVVPLETCVDNTTAELLGVVLGRYVVERLCDLGAGSIEQTYDTQAAAALAEKPPERPRHPLRRALQWSVRECRGGALVGAVSPGSVGLGDKGRCPEDGQHHGGRAGHRACSQEHQRAMYAGATAAASNVWGASDSPRLGGHGVAHTEPSKWRPPRALHPRMEQLLRESPEWGYCWCRYTWGRGTCAWRHAPAVKGTRKLQPGADARAIEPSGGGPSTQWIRHGDCRGGGALLRIISGVPQSHICIAAEGEGMHDWVAVPVDHVHVPATMQEVEFRHWATIVRFFVTDT